MLPTLQVLAFITLPRSLCVSLEHLLQLLNNYLVISFIGHKLRDIRDCLSLGSSKADPETKIRFADDAKEPW